MTYTDLAKMWNRCNSL